MFPSTPSVTWTQPVPSVTLLLYWDRLASWPFSCNAALVPYGSSEGWLMRLPEDSSCCVRLSRLNAWLRSLIVSCEVISVRDPLHYRPTVPVWLISVSSISSIVVIIRAEAW